MAMHWDLFCRVIDNFGDIGVCWRLAADLASRGEQVRLFVDDATALRWMAPDGAAGVSVFDWPADATDTLPGDVVVEAFGCELPDAFIACMASKARAPVWVNLEYLSAEAYVERNHGLRSPQAHGPGTGLVKRFFYPGFTRRTGGLIREPDLLQRRDAFVATAWWRSQGLAPLAGERIVSLFCYDQPALAALLDKLAQQPTLLLATPGPAAQQVNALLGPGLRRGGLRAAVLPALTQTGYDQLLWACDINFVRGEDSFVRAQWAGVPFVWQAYPQTGGAHQDKVNAFLELHLHGLPQTQATELRQLWAAWNGLAPTAVKLPDPVAWRRHAVAWRSQLLVQTDLASQLIGWVHETS